MRTIFGLGPDDPLPDLSMFPIRKLAEISRYATPIGSYVDAYPVHLLTTRSLESMSAVAPGSDFDVRRFSAQPADRDPRYRGASRTRLVRRVLHMHRSAPSAR